MRRISLVRAVRPFLCVAVWLSAFAGGAAAQDIALSAQAPRFLVAPPGARSRPIEVGMSGSALLRRIVSLHVDRPTVGNLLAAIEQQTGARFGYSADVIQTNRVVTLRADSIAVGAALLSILMDTGVDVILSTGGKMALVKRGTVLGVRGTIVGRVTDAKTSGPLVGAEVFLEGTRWRAVTGEQGFYRLEDIEAGNYVFAVRRVGYVKQTRAVTVAASPELTVDVALQPVVTQLNELVTTVTGDQRRVELGHVVGRINADSLVKEAPVSTLSELLNGRVPGLQVFQNQGTVGGQVHLQIRGANSLTLNIEPIVIIDGMRYTTAGSGSTGSPFQSELSSRLNDLNPNDIETIEVVKGPSAATLYGTDASNGVLVVTTKRGQPGPTRWSAYAKGVRSEIPSHQFPDLYWGWGTVFGVPNNPDRSCALWYLSIGACTQQDSVTVLPNPLNDPKLTLFGNQPSWTYGANVAGGRQDLRYYFSGDVEDATGPVRMPPVIADQVRQQQGVSELPDEWRNPNTLTKLNLRANVNAVFSTTADLHVTGGYVHSATRSLAGSQRSAYSTGAFTGTPTTSYGVDNGATPAETFLETSTDRIDRVFGGASGQWRPAAWLTARATVGLDLTGSSRYTLARRGDALHDGFAANGLVGDERTRQLATTAEAGATATLRRGRLTARTAVGAQYVRNLSDVLFALGWDLPPGGTSVGEAANIYNRQTYAETVTLGGYLEEMLGLNERLFVTGALRVDGASTFGQDYNATAYPKLSVSWLISEEPFLPRLPGLDELRLRYAFGTSGQQPTSTMARPNFYSTQAVENGAATSAMVLYGLGNPLLRPERVREHEFGFDATAFASRLRLGLTWYQRRTVDQIAGLELAPGLGSRYANLGLTTQHGFEAEVTARVLDTRFVSWDVMLQHSVHRTKLIELGDAPEWKMSEGGYAEGYSLGARFGYPPIGYNDANGDGIIATSELLSPGAVVYMGESTPPRSQTLTTVLGLFERRLRLSALLERRTGFTQVNALQESQCSRNVCRARVDRSTPLAEQAATFVSIAPEPGDFTRLREVSAAFDLPATVTRALRLRSATLALSARNVALWTDFSGPDPESAAQGTAFPATGGVASGIPQGRSWALRLDLGF